MNVKMKKLLLEYSAHHDGTNIIITGLYKEQSKEVGKKIIELLNDDKLIPSNGMYRRPKSIKIEFDKI